MTTESRQAVQRWRAQQQEYRRKHTHTMLGPDVYETINIRPDAEDLAAMSDADLRQLHDLYQVVCDARASASAILAGMMAARGD